MKPAPPNTPNPPGTPISPNTLSPQAPSESAQRLTRWLTGLVRSRDYGSLASLRRPTLKEKPHILAGHYDEGRHEVFEQVAFLFAVYHQGAARPEWGRGSLGAAARRIGSGLGRGPEDPGASRLMDRIVASRRLPLRHLQHAVVRLRSCEVAPPYWPTLADDMAAWGDRKARVSYQWARDFYAPPPKTPPTKGIELT